MIEYVDPACVHFRRANVLFWVQFYFLYPLKWNNLSFGNRCAYSGENDGQAGKGILAEQIAKLEKKVESQGDEIALLKSALADALRRLKSLEEQKSIVGKFNEAIT